MLAKDMENYLSEIVRVLKKDGRCFITYFLLNPETKALIINKVTRFEFRNEIEGCFVEDEKIPEEAVAYDEKLVRILYSKHYLDIMEPIRYGSWRYGKDSAFFQDIVIAKK